jgi:hypothetical protein
MQALQRRFRSRRLVALHGRVKRLQLQRFCTHKDWEAVCRFIGSRHVQTVYGRWLRALQVDASAREVLAAYTIHGFAESVVGTNRNALEEQVVAAAAQAVQAVEAADSKVLGEYAQVLRRWMERDRRSQLELLAEMHENAAHAKTPCDELEKHMAMLRRHAHKLGGATFLEQFHATAQKRELLVRRTVDAVAKKAFWDHVAQRVNGGDWGVVVGLLEEALDLLCEIARREETRLRDALDIDVVKQQIEAGVLTLDRVKELVLWLVDQIKAFGPPAEDTRVDEWRAWVERQTDAAHLVPEALAQALERLTHIAQTKKRLSRSINALSSRA